jgi:hypothetical protein
MRRAFVCLLMVPLTACATLSPQARVGLTNAVQAAAEEAPIDLQVRAEGKDAHAQLSYSLVLRYGLNHTPVDITKAGYYRRMAAQSRGTTTTAIYVPAAGKVAGHTQLISVPKYDVTEREAVVADECAALLDSATATPDPTACGDAENYARLRPLWARAKQ